jgi:hypothetical protein
MLEKLKSLMSHLPNLLNEPERWDSLIVNRRKPHTYRVFTQSPLNSTERICLHKFDICDDDEAFKHPHPWSGAFLILSGSYRMYVGSSIDRGSFPTEVATFELHTGSIYEITKPLTWHSVVPLETTYTIMLNGQPWSKDVAHIDVRTTKGKDLDKMPEDELLNHLKVYKSLVYDWLKKEGF